MLQCTTATKKQKVNQDHNVFETLPVELIHYLCRFLDFRSIIAIESVSTFFKWAIKPLKWEMKQMYLLNRYFALDNKLTNKIIDRLNREDGTELFYFNDEVFGDQITPSIVTLDYACVIIGNSFKGVLYWDGWIELKEYFDSLKITKECAVHECPRNSCEPHFGYCWEHLIRRGNDNERLFCALQNLYITQVTRSHDFNDTNYYTVAGNQVQSILKYNWYEKTEAGPFSYNLRDPLLVMGYCCSNYGGRHLTNLLIAANYVGNNRESETESSPERDTDYSLLEILDDE